MNYLKSVIFSFLFAFVSLTNISAQKNIVKLSDYIKPNTHENAIPAFIKAIDACKKFSSATLVLEKGRYDFSPMQHHTYQYYESNTTNDAPKNLAILIKGCKNLTIDGAGAELVYHNAIQPITIDNSENITVKNLSIDWDIPLTSQGKVLATSSKNIDLEIDAKQYPYKVKNGKLIFVGENWEAESRWFMEYEANTHRIAAQTGDGSCVQGDWKKYSVTEINPGLVRLNGEFTRTPAVGNYLILRHSKRDHAGIFILESANVKLTNINIYHTTGLGCLSQFSRNLTYNNVNFIPNPAKNRYLSGHDDGFQVSNCAEKINILNCSFGGLMDDPINVHGTSVKVMEKLGATKLRCKFMHEQSTGMAWGHLNDTIGFIENESMETLSKGTLKSFESVNTEDFIVEFNRPVPENVLVGDALENLSWSPSVDIKKCNFGSCRARGLLVSTPGKVLIEGNTFESSGSAILIAGDANGWYESGAVNDVIIRNNIFKAACMTSMYQFCEAIISVYPIIPTVDPQKTFHRNIRIENNIFNAYDYPVLYALSTNGIQFTKNTVVRSNEFKPFHYRKHFITFESCKNAEVKGNKFKGEVLAKDVFLIKMDKKELKSDL